MKKLTAVLLVFIYSQSLYSQTWFDIGLKGGYGADFLVNTNFYNDGNFNPKLSYGYMYGGKLGINFNTEHAITLDVSSSAFNQTFNYTLKNINNTTSDNTRSMGFDALNFLLMYKKTTNSSYLEIGPQYSIVTKTRFSDSNVPNANSDISSNLAKSYFSAVIGFGGHLVGTDNFGISLGLRVSYTFNDIISSTGQQINFPSITTYPSYKPSNPLSAMLILSFDFDLGYMAKSGGNHKRSKFLMF